MQISSSVTIAGCPILEVRKFIRRYRDSLFSIETGQNSLALSPQSTIELFSKLDECNFIRKMDRRSGDQFYELTNVGQVFADASAAKPIHRRTAEGILEKFLERVQVVNATSEYLNRVDHAILFGSMLSNVERVGNANVAVGLQRKVDDVVAFERWSMDRRLAAKAKGRSFQSTLEWLFWPEREAILQLKMRSGRLKLYDLKEVAKTPNLSYRVLVGDPKQIAALIPSGRVV